MGLYCGSRPQLSLCVGNLSCVTVNNSAMVPLSLPAHTPVKGVCMFNTRRMGSPIPLTLHIHLSGALDMLQHLWPALGHCPTITGTQVSPTLELLFAYKFHYYLLSLTKVRFLKLYICAEFILSLFLSFIVAKDSHHLQRIMTLTFKSHSLRLNCWSLSPKP